jgi:hypothetical protein
LVLCSTKILYTIDIGWLNKVDDYLVQIVYDIKKRRKKPKKPLDHKKMFEKQMEHITSIMPKIPMKKTEWREETEPYYEPGIEPFEDIIDPETDQTNFSVKIIYFILKCT